MLKGGYKILDLKNKELTLDIGMVYEGIYEKIEETNKAILVSGLNVEGKEFDDAYVKFDVDGSNFVGKLYGYTIIITDLDIVTITGSYNNLYSPKIVDLLTLVEDNTVTITENGYYNVVGNNLPEDSIDVNFGKRFVIWGVQTPMSDYPLLDNASFNFISSNELDNSTLRLMKEEGYGLTFIVKDDIVFIVTSVEL